MGVILVIGTMLYSAGLCAVLNRAGRPRPGVSRVESDWSDARVEGSVPDRVPAAWVAAYRSEQGG